MDSIKHRILFLYSSPIGVANTGFFSPYWRCQYGLWLRLCAHLRCAHTPPQLRYFALWAHTLRIEPPAGRLYLNAKTPSRPLGGLKAT